MQGPKRLVQRFASKNYHPRSDDHSNIICRGILEDLYTYCEPLRERADAGRIVAKINHTVRIGRERWNLDLAIGPPPGAFLDKENPLPGTPG